MLRTKYILSLLFLWTFFLTGQAERYYAIVDKELTTTPGDGKSWKNAISLRTALEKAVSGDEIWIKGYAVGSRMYYTTNNAQPFKVKSGVRLYGGFNGTETDLNQRITIGGQINQMKYRTIITGDTKDNDILSTTDFIFPGATNQRNDNAPHVLILDVSNNHNTPTVLDGLFITRGHAVTSQNSTTHQEHKGGGVFVQNTNTNTNLTCARFQINRCVFMNNYGTGGGAIYVGKNVNSPDNFISHCTFFNNAAGERTLEKNEGGAIYLEGHANVVNCIIFNNEKGGILDASDFENQVINCTIARNTGSGIDDLNLNNNPNRAVLKVYNTVIWGNTSMTFKDANSKPVFYHCAFVGAQNNNNYNIPLSTSNFGKDAIGNGPHFSQPTTIVGYDVDYNIAQQAYPRWQWDPIEGTTLVDKGDNHYYKNILNQNTYEKFRENDLNGDQRIQGTTIDIGAYEFQPVSNSRRRYVKTGGTGKGTSWADASGDLQQMIDDLAENNINQMPGEVWVAAGEYFPLHQQVSSTTNSATFRMRDGISIHGGFAGTENSKAERKRQNTTSESYPWEYIHKTILRGKDFTAPSAAEYSKSYNTLSNRWNFTSNSYHVVWFGPATYKGENEPFKMATYLEGVTIKGGYAQHTTPANSILPLDALKAFDTHRGAGVYLNTANAYLQNCVVKENNAQGAGGGVYVKDGRVISCLIHNNNSDTQGGGIYVDDAGMVLRSVVSNNTAAQGAGVYLDNNDYNPASHPDLSRPNYLILATSVIANNTARVNGAVYCNQGGVLLHNTITNNFCPTAADEVNADASRTGGVYINAVGLLINSVVWNNRNGATELTKATDVPSYSKNPQTNKVVFINNAMSGVNNTVWNNTLSITPIQLANLNQTAPRANIFGPDFTVGGEMTSENDLNTKIGVQSKWDKITYYWKPVVGSNLWGRGITSSQLPDIVLMSPELDLTSNQLFETKPALGAFQVTPQPLHIDKTSHTNRYILYVNPNNNRTDADGSSWEKAYRSLNFAIQHMAKQTGIPDGIELVIKMHEGTIHPRHSYNTDNYKSASFRILPMKSTLPLRIEGGWRYTPGSETMPGTAERNPRNYRTLIDANDSGGKLEDGNYHAIAVMDNAKTILDGLHIINGYADGNASIQQGAAVIVSKQAELTMHNCVVEDNVAWKYAAIDAVKAKSLTLENCVINNNENKDNMGSPVIGEPENKTPVTYNHVTIVNNIGRSPDFSKNTTSYSAGNVIWQNDHTLDTLRAMNSLDINTMGKEGAKNFANPTNHAGATKGFMTYLGGYSDFTPLTSSPTMGDKVINQASNTPAHLHTDITGLRERDLGGKPDKGAYEALLPKTGRVYYVKTTGNDNNDGLSWQTAFKTVHKAITTAYTTKVDNGEKAQVWVAAGTYQQDPINGSDNCFEVLDGVNVYGAFPATGSPSMDDRHPFISDAIYHDGILAAKDYETILEPKTQTHDDKRRRVLGQADVYNPNTNKQETTYVYVGMGKGDYSYNPTKEYIETPNGSYYYKNDTTSEYKETANGNGQYTFKKNGEYYKVSQNGEYKNATKEDASYKKLSWTGTITYKFVHVGKGFGNITLRYNIFDQVNGHNTVEFGKGDYVVYEQDKKYYKASIDAGANYKQATKDGFYSITNDHVAPEACNYIHLNSPGYYYVGSGFGTHEKNANRFYYVGTNKGEYVQKNRKQFTYPTQWNGFTLRNGYLNCNGITNLGGNGKRNGGAGAAIFTNVSLQNCIIYQCTNSSSDINQELRGGGVYCDEGTLVNCYVVANSLGKNGQETAYGGGVYLYQGTMYNCVIHNNTGYGKHTDGAGIFIENGKFFNNTVVYNHSKGTNRGSGGIQVYRSGSQSNLTIYNCISLYNEGKTGNVQGSANLAVGNTGGKIDCYNSILDSQPVVQSGGQVINYHNTKIAQTSPFITTQLNNTLKPNLRLKTNSIALNMGEDTPLVEGVSIDLLRYTDMDFTDRIKDCRVDAGAYESGNEENIQANTSILNKRIYYVTQNGAGDASGKDLANAACAMKLQQVLNHAGKKAIDYPTDTIVVKVAGYEQSIIPFVYHANTLSDPNDPKSYTYFIPQGVTVMGGYDGKAEAWENQQQKDINRNPMRYRTRFSAIHKDIYKDINGYHAVTFGTSSATTANPQTIIDGIFLEDGKATNSELAEDEKALGGGAIVPENAHVRNCVVMNNEASFGGGLFVKAGGIVTGSLIMSNKATQQGGGIYTQTGKKADQHAYIISCTITDNQALSGGGFYLEDNSTMTYNSVIWGNKATADFQISGVTDLLSYDAIFEQIYTLATDQSQRAIWYPFDNCYVEGMELPTNIENTAMTNRHDTYFLHKEGNGNYQPEHFTLKHFSPLINHGALKMLNEGHNEGTLFKSGVEKLLQAASHDMQGLPRVQTGEERIEAGAFAFLGDQVPDNVLIEHLFVGRGSEGNITTAATGQGDNNLRGRTFYTAFTWLGDAFDYINKARNSKGILGEKAKNTVFKIYMSEGLYKPKHLRVSAISEQFDLRKSSFIVPYNVEIYGGFKGVEQFSSKAIIYGNGNTYTTEDILTLSIDNTTIKFTPLTGPQEQAKLLNSRKYSDFNQNSITEPWEMSGQTILSGNLNTTNSNRNAYHVMYMNRNEEYSGIQHVLIDGITIKDGLTVLDFPADQTQNNEIGRGGGIYSNKMNLALANCRVLNNTGIRGGGIFMRDANLFLFNSIFAGNEAVSESNVLTFGGAVMVSATKGSGTQHIYDLKAINCIWANNSSENYGGAIAAGNPIIKPGESSNQFHINLMNNTLVKNLAYQTPIIFNTYGETNLVNTLMWGNERTAGADQQDNANVHPHIIYSASDVEYYGMFENGIEHKNHLLNAKNRVLNGPYFAKPSTIAGAKGYSTEHCWNPTAITLLTDNGFGKMNKTDEPAEWHNVHLNKQLPNYCQSWIDVNNLGTLQTNLKVYKDYYNKKNPSLRYSGPIRVVKDAQGNEMVNNDLKPIDIGFYEYQYRQNFNEMDAIYVATEHKGKADGSSWDNATDDLRGAILGACNTQKTENPNTPIYIYVKNGIYTSPVPLDDGTAFNLYMGSKANKNICIKGSCTGIQTEQDFNKPSVIQDHKEAKKNTKKLMNIEINCDKKVEIQGFKFCNQQKNGIGIECSSLAKNAKLHFKNTAFQDNQSDGFVSGTNSNPGYIRFVNTLFANNKLGYGINNADSNNITLVNTTFARNKADMKSTITETYNSVAWNNDNQHMPSKNNNVIFEANVQNADIINGPNFVDPEKGDYRIRPSIYLLNKGENSYYLQKGLDDLTSNNIPIAEKDLYNTVRCRDNIIDVGAYEYAANLRPIIYVKQNVMGSQNDGSSWLEPTSDLQGAIDLAGVYANIHPTECGYVFVDNKYTTTQPISVRLPHTKIYGGMNGETSPKTTTTDIVNTLTTLRRGILEGSRSKLSDVGINANESVLDGFEITGKTTIEAGCLSTAIIGQGATVQPRVTVKSKGILYNSLVYGDVNRKLDTPSSVGKVVNVTATGSITAGNYLKHNNREDVDTTNTYVTNEHWKYQLMETDHHHLDKGTNAPTEDCMKMVEHCHDLAGNLRIRGTRTEENNLNKGVDNGCFETWNVTTTTRVSSKDYPHGKSVVYVRKRKTATDPDPELILEKEYSNELPFNPGFLLLEHHTGLRGNGKHIHLQNFAVERDLSKLNSQLATGETHYDLSVMPFSVNNQKLKKSIEWKSGQGIFMFYDGNIRAGMSNKVDGSNTSTAWRKPQQSGNRNLTTGWLILANSNNEQIPTVRFYGERYEEKGATAEPAKLISLSQYNNNVWNTNQFTHKENMGWNLFGSPYLCAMRYDDMEYGRVIYRYDGSKYVTLQTYTPTGESVMSYIPAGDAVFTQTATLNANSGETFNVKVPTLEYTIEAKLQPYASANHLQVALTAKGTTSRSIAPTTADILQLEVVEKSEARHDFEMGCDGVKWMGNPTSPLLFAEQNGGRYAMLTAVDQGEKLPIGIELPSAGNYTFFLPETSKKEDYEVILLHDALTGQSVNLKTKNYDFTVKEAGTLCGRFSLSFLPSDDATVPTINIRRPHRNTFQVNGVQAADKIHIYSADGRKMTSATALGSSITLRATIIEHAIVEIVRNGITIKVVKI